MIYVFGCMPIELLTYEARGRLLGGIPCFRYYTRTGMARGRGRDDVDLLGTSDQERDGGGLHTRRHNPKFLKRKNINLN